MSISKFVRALIAIATFLGLAVAGPTGAELASPEHASIVLITLDTTRADHLGTYGYFRDTDPNLRKFAEKAVVFDRAYTTMATTLPAHVSILTSTYPITHGIKANYAILYEPFENRSGVWSLPGSLREAGYFTAAAISATPLKKRAGLERDFDWYMQPEGPLRSAAATNADVFKLIESGLREPFFLWVHYYDPHGLMTAPAPYNEAFSSSPEQEKHFEDLVIRTFVSPTGEESEVPANRAHDNYDGAIKYMDAQFAQLLSRLQALPTWDELSIVVVGDHGEGLHQHGTVAHGRLYDEQVRVPLIIKFPESLEVAPKRIDRVVSVIDIVPTLVARLGLPVKKSVAAAYEGLDLLGARSDRQVLSERSNRLKKTWEPGQKFALVDENWKYMHSKKGEDELYSLKDDPHELRNVIAAHPAVARAMLAQIEKFTARDIRPMGAASTSRTTVMRREYGRKTSGGKLQKGEQKKQSRTDSEAAAEGKDEERIREELRALGYIE